MRAPSCSCRPWRAAAWKLKSTSPGEIEVQLAEVEGRLLLVSHCNTVNVCGTGIRLGTKKQQKFCFLSRLGQGRQQTFPALREECPRFAGVHRFGSTWPPTSRG